MALGSWFADTLVFGAIKCAESASSYSQTHVTGRFAGRGRTLRNALHANTLGALAEADTGKSTDAEVGWVQVFSFCGSEAVASFVFFFGANGEASGGTILFKGLARCVVFAWIVGVAREQTVFRRWSALQGDRDTAHGATVSVTFASVAFFDLRALAFVFEGTVWLFLAKTLEELCGLLFAELSLGEIAASAALDRLDTDLARVARSFVGVGCTDFARGAVAGLFAFFVTLGLKPGDSQAGEAFVAISTELSGLH